MMSQTICSVNNKSVYSDTNTFFQFDQHCGRVKCKVKRRESMVAMAVLFRFNHGGIVGVVEIGFICTVYVFALSFAMKNSALSAVNGPVVTR